MRRLASIALLSALVLTMAVPAWTPNCGHATRAASATTTGAHSHCADMAKADGDASAADVGMDEDVAQIAPSPASSECPMQCCVRGYSAAKFALAPATQFLRTEKIERVSVADSFSFVVTATATHADRGPPSSILA